MNAKHMNWRKFALCLAAMTACGFVSVVVAVAHPRYAWIAGWLGFWAYVRIESLIELAP